MKNKPDYPALIQEYEKSGMRQKAFCAKNNITYSTFQFWLSKIRKDREKRNRFLPVRVIDQDVPAAIPSPVEICYPDGTILKLNPTSPDWVRQFLPVFKP
jgi:hypothetical protein